MELALVEAGKSKANVPREARPMMGKGKRGALPWAHGLRAPM